MFSILARPDFLIKLVSQEMMTIRAQGGRIIVIWKHLMKIQGLLTNLKVSLTILLVRSSYTVGLQLICGSLEDLFEFQLKVFDLSKCAQQFQVVLSLKIHFF